MTPAQQAERITATVMIHAACRATAQVTLSLAMFMLRAHSESSRSVERLKDMEVQMRNMAVNTARIKAEYLAHPDNRAEVEHLQSSLQGAEGARRDDTVCVTDCRIGAEHLKQRKRVLLQPVCVWGRGGSAP